MVASTRSWSLPWQFDLFDVECSGPAARAGVEPRGVGHLRERDTHEGAVGHWLGCDGSLQESHEDQATVAGVAAVEPEHVLIEVLLQVLVGATALVGAVQEAFEEREDPVDCGE